MPNQSIYLQKSYAEEYNKDRYGGEFGRYLYNQEVKTFLSMIEESNGNILDVGSGSGKLSISVGLRSKNIIAIDSSSEMLEICRKKAAKEKVAVRCVICDAHNLCFRDNSFECVVSSRVLMHLADWRKCLSELCRVSYGTVVMDFPPLQGFSGLDSLLKRCISVFVAGTRTYKAFLIRNVIKELKKHSFRLVAIKKHFFLPIFLHRRLNRPSLSMRIENLCRRLGLVRFLGAPVILKALKHEYQQPKECMKND